MANQGKWVERNGSQEGVFFIFRKKRPKNAQKKRPKKTPKNKKKTPKIKTPKKRHKKNANFQIWPKKTPKKNAQKNAKK